VLVRDSQGGAARVVGPDLDAGASVVHGIDRVLLSGARPCARKRRAHLGCRRVR
jgi:hypothetical protein